MHFGNPTAGSEMQARSPLRGRSFVRCGDSIGAEDPAGLVVPLGNGRHGTEVVLLGALLDLARLGNCATVDSTLLLKKI